MAIEIQQLPDIERQAIEKAYTRWAPIYDAICGPIFETGRHTAAAAARRVGGRILEVGVGTGLSFTDYDHSTEVVGIDLCEPMVAKARQRMTSGFFPHVKAVMVMDAHDLAFADASFNCVVGQFVITLVAEPERVLSECARGQAGRRDHPGQSPLFRARRLGRGRALVRQTLTRAWPAPGISLRPSRDLGAHAWPGGPDRAPPGQAVRCVHVGPLPADRCSERGAGGIAAQRLLPLPGHASRRYRWAMAATE